MITNALQVTAISHASGDGKFHRDSNGNLAEDKLADLGIEEGYFWVLDMDFLGPITERGDGTGCRFLKMVELLEEEVRIKSGS